MTIMLKKSNYFDKKCESLTPLTNIYNCISL
jgi:hypothetical protein